MAPLVETVHEQYAKDRRARVLARHFAELVPEGASVLDVGTGDGRIAAEVQAMRPDIRLSGLEYQVRDDCAIPVEAFDGERLPYGDESFDYVSFLDVLHHTLDPMILLREAVRVARRGLVIKDHLRKGLFAAATLRFMDSVGNRRFGIDLPNTYLSLAEWEDTLRPLGLESGEWRAALGIYPAWANWVFGRGLHFFARLEKTAARDASGLEYWHSGLACCNARWEAAYRRFETSDEEREKFRARFRRLGIDRLPRDAAIVDVFCGRGNGLAVLREWGFTNLTGVDLSPDLLRQCPSGIRRIVADCTELRFEPGTVDVFIVQGGLHHLPEIPGDLERCLGGIRKALKPGGRFFVVEPWNTPFLRMVHAITRNPLARPTVRRFDAFATMVEEEWETYSRWLRNPDVILNTFRKAFPQVETQTARGKLHLIARKSE